MKISTKFMNNRRNASCLFKLIKLAVLTLVVLVVVLFLSLSYIADYALKTITNGTPVTAGIGGVYVNPFSQKIDLTNFYITNPNNYAYKGNAIAFKQVFIDADFSPSQFFSDNLIHVEEVMVDGLTVVMTIKSGTASQSNLSDIVNILNQKAGADSAQQQQQTKQQQTPQQQQAQQQQTAQAQDKNEKPLKIIIDKLVFKNADIKAGYGDKLIPVPMPSFEIKDLGTKQGGLTPAQLVATIMEKLTAEITVKTVSELTKNGMKTLNSALESGSKEANSIIKSGSKEAGSLLDSTTKEGEKAIKSISDGLKNLF